MHIFCILIVFLLRFLGLYEVPCTYLANINIKDILLCLKDTKPPHIFNYPLFKKDKAICSFLFSPTWGIQQLQCSCFVIWWGHQVLQNSGFSCFFCGKRSKLNKSSEGGEGQCQVWLLSISSAIDEKFQAQSMEKSRLQRDTNTLMKPDQGFLFPYVPVCSVSRLPLGLLQLQAALERCWPMFPCAGAAPVLQGAEALLLSELTHGDAGATDPQDQAQAYQSWPGPVSAWQPYLPLSTLTYRAIQGQSGLVPKALHLSPEELPHVSKICCCLWGRDEDWSESDLSLMLLANGACLPAIACTLSVRPGRRWQREGMMGSKEVGMQSQQKPLQLLQRALNCVTQHKPCKSKLHLGIKTPRFYQVSVSSFPDWVGASIIRLMQILSLFGTS